MLPHVVLKSQVREVLFSEQAVRELLPSNLIFDGPSRWTPLASPCCQRVFALDGTPCLRFLARLHAKCEPERPSRNTINGPIPVTHIGVISGCILECEVGFRELDSEHLGLCQHTTC